MFTKKKITNIFYILVILLFIFFIFFFIIITIQKNNAKDRQFLYALSLKNSPIDFEKLSPREKLYILNEIKIIDANNTLPPSLYLIENLEYEHFAKENERLYKEVIFLIITIFVILIISYKKISTLNKKARVDVLTNIGNRLAFNEKFHDVKDETFSMLIFDIDNFKNINDTYGHDFGDEVLSTVGNILKSIENREISIYRIGGEEFAIIFTHFNESFAIESCEYIRKSIENIKWKYPLIVTVSGGFSDSCENIYLECDKRLYKAKNSGKNMIIYQNIDTRED